MNLHLCWLYTSFDTIILQVRNSQMVVVDATTNISIDQEAIEEAATRLISRVSDLGFTVKTNERTFSDIYAHALEGEDP